MTATPDIPPHFTANGDGQLLIGERTAEELVAKAGGTPLFVYDNNIVGGQIARLKAAMPSGVGLVYDVSANPYEPLLRFIARYLDGFRIASLGELERLRSADLETLPLSFLGPGKRDDEIKAAISAGATIIVESEGEAARVIAAGERTGTQPKVAVRVSPLELSDSSVSFGVSREQAAGLVQGLVEAGVDWRGLHMTAAGADSADAQAVSATHAAAVSNAGEIATAAGCALPELTIGDGLPRLSQAEEGSFDVEAVGRALENVLREAPEPLATTRLSFELGSWLVAQAGVYLTRIVERTESGGRTILVVDGGGHHLSGATNMGKAAIAVAHRFGGPPDEEVTVIGCLAAQPDVFAQRIALPAADVGDLLAMFGAGANGPSASPQGLESRPPAGEILV